MKNALMIGALIGATVLAYYNTLPGQFVYDDNPIIVQNPLIRKLDQIPLLFSTSYWGMNIGQPKKFRGGLYRPLTMVTFALNYYAGGLLPRGYHLTNLGLHIGVSLLLWLLCLRLGLAPPASAAAAFLFALLPVHTEAVSNLTGRSEVLSAFFVLLSWILLTGRPPRYRVALGAVCFILALLSKENSAAFWPVLVLSDYVVYPKSWKELIRERSLIWTAYGGSLLLYLEWRYLILGSLADVGGYPYFGSEHSLLVGLSMARFTLQHYMKPLILGIGLCADYTRPSLADIRLQDVLPWLEAFLLSAGLGYAFYALIRHRSRRALVGVLFFTLLFPVSNLLLRLEVIGAERFLYLPSIGYCMGLGCVFDRARGKWPMWSYCILTCLCLWYGWASFQRNKVWQSDELFWRTTLNDAPGSPRAWNGVGCVLMGQKKYDEAIPCFTKALALNPMLLDSHYNLATCYLLKGSLGQAKQEYLVVWQAKPYDPSTLFALATLSEKEHDYPSANLYYIRLLTINPLDRAAQRNLALLHCRMGYTTVCLSELRKFLAGAPRQEPDEDIRRFLAR